MMSDHQKVIKELTELHQNELQYWKQRALAAERQISITEQNARNFDEEQMKFIRTMYGIWELDAIHIMETYELPQKMISDIINKHKSKGVGKESFEDMMKLVRAAFDQSRKYIGTRKAIGELGIL